MLKLDAGKLAKIGVKNMGDFTNIAEDFVEYGMRTESGELLNDEVRELYAETFAIGMAMGDAISKRKHILIGTMIGATGTIMISKIRKKR